MNQKRPSQEEIMEQVQKILEERGRKALEMARNEILQEKIECKEAREALNYFITKYWHDLVRPTLLSLCCEAVGGDPNATTPIAIPLSLISGGIDIHDDIIDQSETKRSRPTVLGKFGKDIALLVGDALLFKGFTLLYKVEKEGIPSEKIQVIIDILRRMFFELGDAEALELQFRGRTDVTPEEYLRVVRKKAADVEAHTRISAIIGGGSKDEVDLFGKYGRLLGMILILRDDLLDYTDFGEALHRIQKENLPFPMLFALHNPQSKSKIVPILLKKTLTERDAKTIQKIIESVGGFEQTEFILRDFTQKACSIIEKLDKGGLLKYFTTALCLPYGGLPGDVIP